MKQIKVFKNPEEVDLANRFLATVPPEQVTCFDDKIIVNYDDQTYPDGYKAEEIRGLMLSNEKQAMTSQISYDVAQVDLARYEEDLKNLESTEITETTLIELTDKVDELKAVPEPALTSKVEMKNWRTENQKKIADAMKLAGDEGKRITDLKTDKAKKVDEFKTLIRTLREANAKLQESINRFTSRNAVMQKHLEALKQN